MFRRSLLLLFLAFTPLLTVPVSVHAVELFDRDVCGKKQVLDMPAEARPAICKDKDLNGANPLTGKYGVLTSLINLLTLIVAIVATIVIILAGLKFVTSGSNPQDVSNAREQIIYALIALVIAALAQVLVRFIIDESIKK